MRSLRCQLLQQHVHCVRTRIWNTGDVLGLVHCLELAHHTQVRKCMYIQATSHISHEVGRRRLQARRQPSSSTTHAASSSFGSFLGRFDADSSSPCQDSPDVFILATITTITTTTTTTTTATTPTTNNSTKKRTLTVACAMARVGCGLLSDDTPPTNPPIKPPTTTHRGRLWLPFVQRILRPQKSVDHGAAPALGTTVLHDSRDASVEAGRNLGVQVSVVAHCETTTYHQIHVAGHACTYIIDNASTSGGWSAPASDVVPPTTQQQPTYHQTNHNHEAGRPCMHGTAFPPHVVWNPRDVRAAICRDAAEKKMQSSTPNEPPMPFSASAIAALNAAGFAGSVATPWPTA